MDLTDIRKKYLYIRALNVSQGDEEEIGFDHVIVEAIDEEQAYDRGHETWQPGDPRTPMIGGRSSVLNDYVIDVEEALQALPEKTVK